MSDPHGDPIPPGHGEHAPVNNTIEHDEVSILANRINMHVSVKTPGQPVSQARRTVISVDPENGHVDFFSEWTTVDTLWELEALDVIEKRAIGPEDSEWFLTDHVQKQVLENWQYNQGWKIIAP